MCTCVTETDTRIKKGLVRHASSFKPCSADLDPRSPPPPETSPHRGDLFSRRRTWMSCRPTWSTWFGQMSYINAEHENVQSWDFVSQLLGNARDVKSGFAVHLLIGSHVYYENATHATIEWMCTIQGVWKQRREATHESAMHKDENSTCLRVRNIWPNAIFYHGLYLHASWSRDFIHQRVLA